MRIDTHQHLLEPNRFGYSWASSVPALRGDHFGLADYHRAAAGLGVIGTVFMEVDVDEGQAGGEAARFCALAADPVNRILGVVASGRPEHEGFETYLDQIDHPALKGMRRVLHTQPDALSASALFRANLARLTPRGLTFDLCVLARQLPVALALAEACPEVTFILDHAGLPPFNAAAERFATWREDIRKISRRPHVHAKLSGLVTCLPPRGAGGVSTDSLRPTFEHLLACFGPERLVWGGDWPVCNLAADLAAWCAITDELLAPLSPVERAAILYANARRLYRLAS